jgi:replication factor C subunit 2/4
MSDVSAQEEIIKALSNPMTIQNLPHLLFYGPPGTGKTSTILAMARDIYGVDLMKTRVLELNASDERGINVIREKVKDFARLKVSGGNSSASIPPYKLIILDEADSLTNDAQAALRRIIENYSTVTRFCLICNYVSRIIEPLASRCAKFRFKSLDFFHSLSKLKDIAEKEKVLSCNDHFLKEIIKVSEGDLRKAITFLQSIHRLAMDNDCTDELICDISGIVPSSVIERFLPSCKNFESMQSFIESIIYGGYSALQFISQVFCFFIVVI